MRKAHLAVLKDQRGQAQFFPMKEWLQQNPAEVPEGLDASSSTSHELRRGLCKRGWQIRELSDKVLVIRPDSDGGTGYADEFSEDEEETAVEPLQEKIEEAQIITLN